MGKQARRPRSAERSRAAIVAAARARFGAHGFDRTTIRAVAGDAGVDPALVIRYFGNKAGLFAAASRIEIGLPDLRGVPPDELAERLLPHFFAVWEDDPELLPMLRAAATSPSAAQAMVQIFAEQVAPALAVVTPDRADERAALVGALILGLAMQRYVLHLPPLVEMQPEQLRRWLTPVFAYFLTAAYPKSREPVRGREHFSRVEANLR